MERASTFMDVNKTHDVYHMPVIALNLRDAQANRRQFIIFVVAGYTGYEAAKVNYSSLRVGGVRRYDHRGIQTATTGR